MNIQYKAINNLRDVYACMEGLAFPYHYEADFDLWEKSYAQDTDGEGRALFSDLTTTGAYLGDDLIGFVQYGRSAFGFSDCGEPTDTVSYPIIRNLFFPEDREEIGVHLLDEALTALSGGGRIYAFFHYFGMSCYARHGKLFEGFGHIHRLLLEKGFMVEHENVFYASELTGTEPTPAALNWHELSPGRQRYCDFILENEIVGGCEVHFPEKEDIAYLRWIFVDPERCGKGIGSKCMTALKNDLYQKGIRKFDTDTAMTNTVAQHFYEKNNFVRRGLTRSYYISGR
ncbi:MAG: GNAT family N-acetyltransferase [Hominenteromicrobium sp.]